MRRRLIGVCVERLELGRRMERDRYGFKFRIPPRHAAVIQRSAPGKTGPSASVNPVQCLSIPASVPGDRACVAAAWAAAWAGAGA